MIALDQEDTSPLSAPIDMLEHYFGAHGWAFERTGDDEIVANVQGSWASYELRAVWRVEDRVLHAFEIASAQVGVRQRVLSVHVLAPPTLEYLAISAATSASIVPGATPSLFRIGATIPPS